MIKPASTLYRTMLQSLGKPKTIAALTGGAAVAGTFAVSNSVVQNATTTMQTVRSERPWALPALSNNTGVLGRALNLVGDTQAYNYALGTQSNISPVKTAWHRVGYSVLRSFTKPMREVRTRLNEAYWGNRLRNIPNQNLGPTASRMGGPGYLSWYKEPGRRMPVNHLGASGDLALSLHTIRNRRS